MRQIRIRTAFFLSVIFVTGCSEDPSTDSLGPVAEVEKSVDLVAPPEIENHIAETAALSKILEEATVRDAIFDPEAAVEWHIAVDDDGTRRDGFAEYICMLLAEHQLVEETTSVRIVDYSAVISTSSFRDASLGHVRCKYGDRMVP